MQRQSSPKSISSRCPVWPRLVERAARAFTDQMRTGGHPYHALPLFAMYSHRSAGSHAPVAIAEQLYGRRDEIVRVAVDRRIRPHEAIGVGGRKLVAKRRKARDDLDGNADRRSEQTTTKHRDK